MSDDLMLFKVNEMEDPLHETALVYFWHINRIFCGMAEIKNSIFWRKKNSKRKKKLTNWHPYCHKLSLPFIK